jgi:hypothetical protein
LRLNFFNQRCPNSSDDGNGDNDTRTAGLYADASTTAINVSAETGYGLLAKSLNWLTIHASANTAYSILIDADEILNPTTLSQVALNNAANLVVNLKGLGTERIIQLGATNGSLLAVDEGMTLFLDGYLTLKGRSNNTASLVHVNTRGTLAMKGTSNITGNTASSSGGGVSVNGGSFTMSDSATVSGNTASSTGRSHRRKRSLLPGNLKHTSPPNMEAHPDIAELELSALAARCPGTRRIGDIETLNAELSACLRGGMRNKRAWIGSSPQPMPAPGSNDSTRRLLCKVFDVT